MVKRDNAKEMFDERYAAKMVKLKEVIKKANAEDDKNGILKLQRRKGRLDPSIRPIRSFVLLPFLYQLSQKNLQSPPKKTKEK